MKIFEQQITLPNIHGTSNRRFFLDMAAIEKKLDVRKESNLGGFE